MLFRIACTLFVSRAACDALFTGATLDDACEIIVTLPARNEAVRIGRALDALARQRTLGGYPFPAARFEVLLLVNNTHDDSAGIAAAFSRQRPEIRLHVEDRDYAPADANAGHVRLALFEAACGRFEAAGRCGIIATTDADSVVDAGWLDGISRATATGADAVTGRISACTVELHSLSAHARALYALDQRYRRLLDRYEALVDPDAGDPMPRHHHHTGASFAVTTAAYRRCGGMPRVTTHEDIALYRALRRCDAVIRHAPDVLVTTSARTHARACDGMGERLAEWDRGAGDWLVEHPALSCARFERKAAARRTWRTSARTSSFGRCWELAEELGMREDGGLGDLPLEDAVTLLEERLRSGAFPLQRPRACLPIESSVASGAG